MGSSLEDGVLNGCEGREARSAESGAAPAGEAPCCPYSSLSLQMLAPWLGFPQVDQKCLKPSFLKGQGGVHLPLLNFLHAVAFLVSQSL